MEKLPSVKALSRAIIAALFLVVAVISVKIELPSSVSILGSYLQSYSIFMWKDYQPNEENVEVIQTVLEVPLSVTVVPKIVYDGMTLDELGEKLNRSLKSTLSGYGPVIAKKAIDTGVDPYVAVAIILHETGCYFGTCSTLASQCNNIGGMKGGPTCGGSAYRAFSTLEEGIQAFINNLSKNYYQKGLTTVELIGKKYAESNTWSTKVNYYIEKIKAN